jgi:exopolyphosphatase/guanosine-5'-triphosphate,3'-diphosphate pyrophosphatase
MRRYAQLVDSLDVDHTEVVATSATREAENGTAFVDTIFDETGLMPRVISGCEEGTLIHRAVRHSLALGERRTAVIDIGGGSVELVVGDAGRLHLSESLRLGVQRLLDQQGRRSDRLTAPQKCELQGYIQGIAQEVCDRAKAAGFGEVVGTSGTIRALGECILTQNGSERVASVNAQRIDVVKIARLTRQLCAMDEDDRSKLPGISGSRADAIHLGGVVLARLLQMLGSERLTLSDASLREGVIIDFLDRHAADIPTHRHIPDVRRRAVCDLARRYGRDDPRDRHIANLALQLFDQTLKLHGLGTHEKELLEFAALLHAVGKQIGFERRNQHSAYIIRHARLRGFTDDEINLLALIARYHREAKPSKRHPEYKRLGKRSRRIVALLSGILRIAVALDRGQSQQVRGLTAQINKLEVTILLHGAGELELELWAARTKIMPLAEMFDRRIRLRRHEPAHTEPPPAPANPPD